MHLLAYSIVGNIAQREKCQWQDRVRRPRADASGQQKEEESLIGHTEPQAATSAAARTTSAHHLRRKCQQGKGTD